MCHFGAVTGLVDFCLLLPQGKVVSMTDSPWQTTSTELMYENNWISVREDHVVRPDGGSGIYGVMTVKRPAVFVVAVSDSDEVLLVNLYRYATNGWSLELPAGGADEDDLLAAAQRELLEETGYTAASWRQIGSANMLNGVCNAPETFYLATDLALANDEAQAVASEQQLEGISGVRALPWPEVMRLIEEGAITDGETVAGLMYAALALGKIS